MKFWLNSLYPLFSRNPSARRVRGRMAFQPALDVLEDRWCPAIIHVQDIGTAQQPGTPVISVNTAVTAGDSIIIAVVAYSAGAAGSVTDSVGNVYSQDVVQTSSIATTTYIFSSHNVMAIPAAGSITLSFPGGSIGASASEWSGLAATSTLDQGASADTGGSSTPSSGFTATTTQASELLIGAFGTFTNGGAVSLTTPGPGYTALPATTDGGLAYQSILPEYQIVAATGNYQANGTLSASPGYSAAVIATYIEKPASTTTLVSSLNPSITGASVTFTATVTLSNAMIPLGTVTFFDGGVPLDVPVPLVNGVASLDTAALTLGNHTITATYNVAVGFDATTSDSLPLTQVVLAPTNPGNPAAKLTSVTSTTQTGKYNEGDTVIVTANFDQPVTLSSGTLTVNLNDGGTVTFGPFSNKSSVTGTYTVAPGQNTQSLDSVSLTVTGGTLKDGSGNTVTTAIPQGKSLTSSGNYLIDTANPTVTISIPSAATTTAGPISYTINYADTNFNTNTLTAADVTLNKTGTANGTVTVTGQSGGLKTVTISNITGTGTLGISLAAGTASDTVGNLAPAAGPSATFSVVNNSPATAFAVGGANGTVRLLSKAGDLIQTLTPIAGYTGLVSVALGDFNADGTPDLAVAAAAPSGVAGLAATDASKVFVYDGAAAAKGTLTLIHTFTPFANHDAGTLSTAPYTNGLNIAVGDIDGDNHADLIAGTRGGNGTTSGQVEIGRLVAIEGVSDTIIGGIKTPFGAGYQKGVIVAAGNVDGLGGDEIAVTRGGPVASPDPAVQTIKVKVLQLRGTDLTELPLNADGSTAFAPFAQLTGAAKGISRDGRVAFVDTDGDGKDELVFSALDPLTSGTNEQVRIGVYAIDPAALTGAATIKSTGPDAGTYLTGSAVVDHATTHVAGTGTRGNIALLTESAASGIVYLAPLTGVVQTGGFSLSIVTGGITINGI